MEQMGTFNVSHPCSRRAGEEQQARNLSPGILLKEGRQVLQSTGRTKRILGLRELDESNE